MLGAEVEGHAEPTRRGDGTRRRTVLILAVLAFAFCFARNVPFLGAPFENAFRGYLGGRYQGGIQRAYAEGGWLALEGRPIVTPMPTIPVSGETYVSHPPLFHWATALSVEVFGWFRDHLPALSRVLQCGGRGGAGVARCAVAGSRGGIATGVLFLASPMSLHYGFMVNYESPVLLFALVMVWLAGRRSPGRGALAGAALAAFVGMLHDWPVAFAVAGLFLVGLPARRPLVGWRPSIVLGTALVLAAAVYLALLAHWEGGLGEAWEGLTRAVHSLDRKSYTVGEFALAQVGHISRFYTWPLIALALIGLAVAIRRGRAGGDPDAAQLLPALAIFGLLNIVVFHGRAIDHPFWPFYLQPFLMLAGALGLVASCRGSPTVLAVLLILLAGWGVFRWVEVRRAIDAGPVLNMARQINGRADRDTLVIMPLYTGPWYFYCQPWFDHRPVDREGLEHRLAELRGGRLAVNELIVVCEPRRYPVPEFLARSHRELGMQRLEQGGLAMFVAGR